VLSQIINLFDDFLWTTLDTTKRVNTSNWGTMSVSWGNLSLSASANRQQVVSVAQATSSQNIDVTFNIASEWWAYYESAIGILWTFDLVAGTASNWIDVIQSSYDNTLRLYYTKWWVQANTTISQTPSAWAKTRRIVYTAATKNVKVYQDWVLKFDVNIPDANLPTSWYLAYVRCRSWTTISMSINSITATAT